MQNSIANINYEAGCLKVSGELNFVTVMDLWNKSLFYLSKNSDIRINLAAVTQVNSAALALLLDWLKYAKQNHKRISFESLPEQLRSIAKVSGVDKFLV